MYWSTMSEFIGSILARDKRAFRTQHVESSDYSIKAYKLSVFMITILSSLGRFCEKKNEQYLTRNER